MKIFFCEVFKTYTADATIAAMERMGHTVRRYVYPTPENIHRDDAATERIVSDVKKEMPDVVFTVNFWGVVAEACQVLGVPYIAWVYDSPMEIRDTSPMRYDTNRIFLFDRTECEKYSRQGISNVFYLPLATDVQGRRVIRPWKEPLGITLVGSLYDSTLPMLLAGMGEFERGYLEAVMAAQRKVCGDYIVPELLSADVMERVNASYARRAAGVSDTGRAAEERDASDEARAVSSSGMEGEDSARAFQITAAELSWAVAAELTHRERLLLLRLLASRYDTSLFSFKVSENDRRLLAGVHINGPLDYTSEMPGVFASAKINLNPILYANGNGIPLRAIDVLSCGGFLLSSWREDFLNYFVPDEEVVLYTCIEDAVEKADFYMRNDALREKIAAAGRVKVEKDFTYEARLEVMLGTV
ncbi:MAG: glycosyltransferase [Lachnospiraceae bacterium]|nr:glycosyltransferase [Lachnospiraceae bacterium]